MRLRNAASEAWKQAMRVPPSERCGALYHASLATEATLNYANNNHESCDISVPLLNQVEGYHREAVQARDNVAPRTSRGMLLYCCGAAGLLTASCRTSLLAACAPLLTPLHTARLGLSI